LDLTFHQKRADRRQPLSRRRVSSAQRPIGRLVSAGGAAPPTRDGAPLPAPN